MVSLIRGLTVVTSLTSRLTIYT